MVNKPGQCQSLHPGADERNALPAEKQPVIPVLQRTEYHPKPAGAINFFFH
jgi:hypothetical protein